MPGRVRVLILILAASCSRSGEKNAGSAEELLAARPAGAVVTAPLAALAQHAATLSDRAASLPGGDQLADTRKQLGTQLGFDPFTRKGLQTAGIDPDRGAAVVLDVGAGAWTAALPVARPDRFLQAFDRLARERARYEVRTDEVREGARIATYARDAQAGTGRRVAVAVVRGYGVIARGVDPAALIAEAAARKPDESLARDPGLSASRKKLGAQDLVVFAPAGSPLPQRFGARALPGDAALGLSGSAQGLAARAIALLPAPDAARAQATLPGGGADLVALLPADAPFRARLGLAPARLYAVLRALPALAELIDRLRAAMKGADLEQDLFAAIQPGVVASLSLAKGSDLGKAIDSGFDFRRKSPFDTVQLVALAQVADRSRVQRALASVATALPRLGARVRRRGDDYQVDYAAGQGARFGVREVEGRTLAYVLGGGIGPDDLRPAAKAVAPSAAPLYANEGAALLLDLGRLSESLRALPESAFGSGPQSYVARSLVSQVIDPLRALRAGASALASADGVTADLQLEILEPK